MQYFLLQIWYEAICDISQDTELLLGPKVPLLINDMRSEADDRSGSGESIIHVHFYRFLRRLRWQTSSSIKRDDEKEFSSRS
jgi:hypothetical protein